MMKLNIEEVAQSLDLPSRTVLRWIRQGRIPIHRSGDECMFEPAVLEKWARTHHLVFRALPQKPAKKTEAREDTLVQAMKRGGVYYDVPGSCVKDVLKAGVDRAPSLSSYQKSSLYEKILERETLTSTGIGKGLAIPHPRVPESALTDAPMILTCFLKENVDFNAVDDQPVSVLFVLLSPTTKLHLHLLSRLSFCVRDNAFVSFLKTAPDAAALFSRIAEFETRLDKPDRSRVEDHG